MAQPNASPVRSDSRSEGRSISELLQQLTEQSTRLAQKETELAKAEMTAKGKRLGIGAGAFSAAGLLGLFALAALSAAAILALATGMEGWLAALIVAVVYALLAGALALVGRSKVQAAAPPVPERTAESVKEDIRQTKEKARREGHERSRTREVADGGGCQRHR
jgi:hypothetical protein